MAIISVIVPVYNVRDRLVDCLDSIRGQSMVDFECILVDDGSTDGTSELLNESVKMDPRFRIIHQNNSGVGAARNRGLKSAEGTFVTFIDSDDWVASKYLDNMLSGIGEQDILIAGFTMCKPNGREAIGTVTGGPSENNLAQALKEGLLNSCWGKLFRRDVISGVRFSEEILWGEDTAFLLSCLCRTENIAFSPSHDYFYTFSTSGLANRFDQRKPFYLSVYYQYLILFLDQWTQKGNHLYNEASIKVSQEVLRTVDALIGRKLLRVEMKKYLQTLFGDVKVNELFSYGVRLDDNPLILKILSKFPNWVIWDGYIRIRNCILKGKR